jgi:hypothetical protein
MALIPGRFVDAVCAIGEADEQNKLQARATGFIYNYHQPDGEAYWVYLVTNRHVFEGRPNLAVRLHEPKDKSAPVFLIPLLEKRRPCWTGHPDPSVDLGVLQLRAGALRAQGLEGVGFHSNRDVMFSEEAADRGVFEGDGVFALGFPMGLAGVSRNAVMVRGGVISLIQPWLNRQYETFLVDAQTYPGNSGGPVVTRPDCSACEGSTYHGRAALIGVVCASLAYRDLALSAQTMKPVFHHEENSGLTIVVGTDAIQQVILLDQEKRRKRELRAQDRIFPSVPPSRVVQVPVTEKVRGK